MRRSIPLLLLLVLGCVPTDDDPTKAPPEIDKLPEPVTTDTEQGGLVVMIRPTVSKLSDKEPLRIALHWAEKKGPLSWRDPRKVSWADSVNTFTYHIKTPDGRKQDLTAGFKEKLPAQQLGYSPTQFLTLTNEGITRTGNLKGTWKGEAPDLSRAGKYLLSVSGSLVDATPAKMTKIPFKTGEVSIELGVSRYEPLEKVRKLAQDAIDTKDKVRGTLPIIEDRNGTRVVRFTGPSPQIWSHTEYTVPVSPYGKVGKVESRIVFTCLAEGSMIHTKNGLVPIERLEIGDAVLGYDLGENKIVETEVRGIRPGTAPETLLLAGRLRVTGAHPIHASGRWVRAEEVSTGDTLLDVEGRPLKVGTIERNREPVPVFDLTVDEPHNFFADGVLVHNKSRIYSPELDDPWYQLWPLPKKK